MSKVLTKYKINFILLQMIAFSFICIMAYVDYFLSFDPKLFLRITVLTSTIIAVIIYEIILFTLYYKARKRYLNETVEEKNNINYNEKYLWFVLLLFLDILIILLFIKEVYKEVNMFIALIISFVIYNVISKIVKPYFGIKHKK